MFCKNCGIELNKEANFCRDCGISTKEFTEGKNPKETVPLNKKAIDPQAVSANNPKKFSKLNWLVLLLFVLVIRIVAGSSYNESLKGGASEATFSIIAIAASIIGIVSIIIIAWKKRK